MLQLMCSLVSRVLSGLLSQATSLMFVDVEYAVIGKFLAEPTSAQRDSVRNSKWATPFGGLLCLPHTP